MRMLLSSIAVNANDVTPNLGGLYRYPYPTALRNEEKNEVVGQIDSYAPFVVLDCVEKTSGKYLKVLTTTGEVGFVQHNPRYLKEMTE